MCLKSFQKKNIISITCILFHSVSLSMCLNVKTSCVCYAPCSGLLLHQTERHLGQCWSKLLLMNWNVKYRIRWHGSCLTDVEKSVQFVEDKHFLSYVWCICNYNKNERFYCAKRLFLAQVPVQDVLLPLDEMLVIQTRSLHLE